MTSLLFPHAPASAGAVRHALVRELRAAGVPDAVVDDAVLVASELVGNAVRHGAPLHDRGSASLRVSWWVAAGAVHLEVCDGGPGPDGAALERVGYPEGHPDGGSPTFVPVGAESGRGLPIVDLLSNRWGTTAPSPRGAVGVYAELPLPGAPPSGLSRGGHDALRRGWSTRTSPSSSWPWGRGSVTA